jgi:hypothetical protein
MPDIDLEPGKNYRAPPVKGEKAFAPGGLKRLFSAAAWLAFAVAVGTVMVPIAQWLRSVTWPY